MSPDDRCLAESALGRKATPPAVPAGGAKATDTGSVDAARTARPSANPKTQRTNAARVASAFLKPLGLGPNELSPLVRLEFASSESAAASTKIVINRWPVSVHQTALSPTTPMLDRVFSCYPGDLVPLRRPWSAHPTIPPSQL